MTINPNSAAVLLADADPHDAERIISAFGTADFENPIQVVSRGEDLIQYLSGQGPYADRARFPFPRLLLLDAATPGIDPWAVLSWLRQQRNFPFLPVVLLTASLAPAEKEKAMRLGAAACELKPANFDQLVPLIDRIGSFWLLSPSALREPKP